MHDCEISAKLIKRSGMSNYLTLKNSIQIKKSGAHLKFFETGSGLSINSCELIIIHDRSFIFAQRI